MVKMIDLQMGRTSKMPKMLKMPKIWDSGEAGFWMNVRYEAERERRMLARPLGVR
jgi:hypothetical protein